ncbi:MAG: hypothetical protein GQ570_11885 [Helicobacteraceae bacterium]|nr:hypothetical protein [Helicobacteraceae bacterium]
MNKTIIKFNIDKRLKHNQADIFRDESRFKVAACGRRFGKSYLATYIILTKALDKKGNYFFVAPTFQQARQILWELLKDKVRDKLSTKINESRLEVTLINGSVISLKGGDRADTMRGVSLAGCVLDEFATIRDSNIVWQEVLRPALSDQKGWCLFISSPKGREYFYDLYNNAKTSDDWNSWQFTTLDGGYVDEDEVTNARNDLDERSFRQEYEASFESYEGLVVPYYDRELNASKEEIQEHDTLIFGIDFNVNKMPCAVFVKRNSELHLVDFFFGSFNTDALMESIELKYKSYKKIFHTDATGIANKSSAGGQTDITIIKNKGYIVYNLSRNPNIIDRVNSFNSMIKAVDGTRKLFVSTKIKKAVETLEKHFFDENGLPNKKHEYHDDVFDAMSYAVYHYSDYAMHQVKRVGMSGH